MDRLLKMYAVKEGFVMVSVIMSVYNEKSDWVRKSIESILNQTYKDIEFVVVLDNPNNSEILGILQDYKKRDKRIKLHFNDTNLGLAKSLNIGINISGGEYIARMDADDISYVDRIEKQVYYMDKHPEIDMIGGRVKYIDEHGKRLLRNNWKPTDIEKVKKLMAVSNVFIHPTLFFRRNILSEIEGYNDINPAQDYEFITRAITLGYNVTNINKEILDYRVRKDSISNINTFDQMINAAYIRDLYRNKRYFNQEEFAIYKNQLKKKEENFDLAQQCYILALTNKSTGKILKFFYSMLRTSILSGLWRHVVYEICILKIVQMLEGKQKY